MDTTLFQGRRIAVPETRQLDVFSQLLSRRGAQVVRCPLVGIRDCPDPEPVYLWLQRLARGDLDAVVFYTGEGVQRLLARADEQPELKAAVVQRLQGLPILARGPKPAKALREIGVRPSSMAVPATTEGVIAGLKTWAEPGQTFGIQVYGAEPPPALIESLPNLAIQADFVAPYIYTDEATDQEVRALITQLVNSALDAIAFTSSAQVRRLFRVAEASGQQQPLRLALCRTTVASVGPVVSACLAEYGVDLSVQPSDSYFLKPLTQALGRHLA